MSELKPCPFCGGKAEIQVDGLYRWVECQNKKCNGTSKIFMFINDAGNANDIVAENWNTRPLEKTLLARVAELEAAEKELDRALLHYLSRYPDLPILTYETQEDALCALMERVGLPGGIKPQPPQEGK